ISYAKSYCLFDMPQRHDYEHYLFSFWTSEKFGTLRCRMIPRLRLHEEAYGFHENKMRIGRNPKAE
ncbi:MAG: hypothetical protein K0Q80_370, partial [Microvirga sp.]|nr:hypothetical protein [Microvirga sp.]